MSDVSTFLADSDYQTYPSFKFPNVGDQIVGEIVGTPRVVETTDIGSTETSPKLVIDITSTADGETYSVWVKKGLLAKAIAEAVKKAGASGLAEGGTLGIKHTGLGTPSQPGFNPPKQWAATYKAPVTTVPVDGEDPFAGL